LKAVETSSGDRAINHLKADPGFERALAAALGDDVDAALTGDASRRWAGAEAQADDPALPGACEPLAAHVHAPAALARRLSQVGVVEVDDGSIILAVGQRLVTRDGRLRRWDGYVATGLGAGCAERLIRLQPLAEIEARSHTCRCSRGRSDADRNRTAPTPPDCPTGRPSKPARGKRRGRPDPRSGREVEKRSQGRDRAARGAPHGLVNA
jgi:hypothetical protein